MKHIKQVNKNKIASTTSNNFAAQKNIPLLLIFILTVITFSACFAFDFVNWDDNFYIYDNPFINTLSIDNLKAIFTQPVNGNYNPLPILMFAIEKSLFGLNPAAFHGINVAWHIVCTSLAYSLFKKLGLNTWASLFATALFAIHPLRVESVAWITERKDVVFGTFYIAALLSYLSYTKNNKTWVYSLTLILFILSLLSKIQAVSLPLSMLAIDYYINKPLNTLKIWINKVPFFALSMLFGLIGIYFLQQAETLDITKSFLFIQRLFFASYAISSYIFSFFVPVGLSACYPYPANGTLPITYYLSMIILLALCYAVFYSLKYNKVLMFAFLFFIINIIFVLQIVGAGQGFIADRFTYIAYIGLFFALAYGFEKLKNYQPNLKIPLNIMAISVILLFSILSYKRTKVWENSETLWSDVILKYKNIELPYNNRGMYYKEKGKIDKALADYNKALEIEPKYALAYNNRGNIYFAKSDLDKALNDYNKVIELSPNNAKAYNNVGAVKFKQNDYESALQNVNKALTIQKVYPDATLNKAVIYTAQQKYELALAEFTTYLKYIQNNSQVYNWRGAINRFLKQYNEAVQDANIAISLQPNNGEYYYQRSISYLENNNKIKALEDAKQAQTLGYTVPESHWKLLQ